MFPIFYHYKPPFPWRSTAACHQCHARHLSKIVFELGGQFLLRFLERLHSNPAQVHKPIAPHSLHRSELFGAVICYIAMGSHYFKLWAISTRINGWWTSLLMSPPQNTSGFYLCTATLCCLISIVDILRIISPSPNKNSARWLMWPKQKLFSKHQWPKNRVNVSACPKPYEHNDFQSIS